MHNVEIVLIIYEDITLRPHKYKGFKSILLHLIESKLKKTDIYVVALQKCKCFLRITLRKKH